MKKFVLLTLAVVVAVGLAGAASAHMWGSDGDGTSYGMGPGMMYGYGTGNTVTVEKFKQFQKDTAVLRDELSLKQVELQSEFAKDTPDAGSVTTLRKDILDLQAKIAKAADKAGIDTDRGPGRNRGYGHRGYGMRYGSGYGCTW